VLLIASNSSLLWIDCFKDKWDQPHNPNHPILSSVLQDEFQHQIL
jgi:hypothetical protein